MFQLPPTLCLWLAHCWCGRVALFSARCFRSMENLSRQSKGCFWVLVNGILVNSLKIQGMLLSNGGWQPIKKTQGMLLSIGEWNSCELFENPRDALSISGWHCCKLFSANCFSSMENLSEKIQGMILSYISGWHFCKLLMKCPIILSKIKVN